MKNYFYLLLICLPNISYSQQLPLFTQYRDQWGLINPATLNGDYLLYETKASAGISHRQQWTKQPDAPRTQNLHGEYIFDDTQVGLLAGGYLINDQTGPTGFTGLYGRLAGLVTGNPYAGAFSLGLNFGIVQHRIKTTEAVLNNNNDDLITACDCKQLFPDVGFGLFYHKLFNKGFFKNDNVYAGFSVPQLLGLNLKYKTDSGDFSIQKEPHVYLLLGMYKTVSDVTFIEPSVWVKYVPNAPINVDVNLRFQRALEESYDDYKAIVLGAGYALNHTFHLEFSYLFGGDVTYKIGYGFDHAFEVYGPVYGNSHEFNLSCTFGE